MSNNKKKDHKDHKPPSPPVKVGEVVQEKAPRDKEKAEGPASTERENRGLIPLASYFCIPVYCGGGIHTKTA